MLLLVTGGRLTTQELGWLLAQEARGAAKSLRAEVSVLRGSQRPPPASEDSEERISVTSVPAESSFRALDQALGLLGDLTAGPRRSSRRTRIDLAALLYELAPDCRIALQPGAGTEVFGDETAYRRLFHLLLTRGPGGESSAKSEITVRREGEWIRVSVNLGPDTASASDLERRWLQQMVQKQGGRFELLGRMQTIVLPAEQSPQAQVAELKQELAQAQQLGETYARELASVLASEFEAPLPAAQAAAPDNSLLFALRAISAALHPRLKQLTDALAEAGPNEAQREPLSGLKDLVQELSRLAGLNEKRPERGTDVAKALQAAAATLSRRAERREVTVELECVNTALLNEDQSVVDTLAQALLSHAIDSSPLRSTIRARLWSSGASLFLETIDRGPSVSVASAAALLNQQVDPAAFGRPRGMALLTLNAICNHIGKRSHSRLTLSPCEDGAGTVTRVELAVTSDPS
ncbi:MAG: hypothetical protein RJA70_3986 [Pseudomonadota bacterium]|jgi:hypothetical protein